VEAQLHQEEILRHLQTQYGLNTIFVEGGLGDLMPELLHFFKDSQLNGKLMDKLTDAGLVGGVERFLSVRNAQRTTVEPEKKSLSVERRVLSAPKAYGVEDAKLYRRELELFREVYDGKPMSDQFLGEMRQSLLAQSAASFNKELKTFFREWLFQKELQKNILSHLSFLQKYAREALQLDLTDAREQYDWPMLVRFFKLKELEKWSHEPRFTDHEEKKKLKRWLEENAIVSKQAPVLRLLLDSDRGPWPVVRGSRDQDIRATLERFYAAASPLGFKFEDYPALSRSFGRRILSQELQIDELVLEMERLNGKILGVLAKTPEEKAGVAKYQKYLMLRKLFSLELTRGEYQQVLAQRATGNVQREKVASPALSVERCALRFYEIAEQREQAIFKNMLAKMKETKQPNAVLITGGFHSEGLSEVMKQSGMSYVRIAPRISGKVDDSNYLRVMTLGQISGFVTHSSGLDKMRSPNESQVSSPKSRAMNARFAPIMSGPEAFDAATVSFVHEELRTSMKEIAGDRIPDVLPNAWLASKRLQTISTSAVEIGVRSEMRKSAEQSLAQAEDPAVAEYKRMFSELETSDLESLKNGIKAEEISFKPSRHLVFAHRLHENAPANEYMNNVLNDLRSRLPKKVWEKLRVFPAHIRHVTFAAGSLEAHPELGTDLPIFSEAAIKTPEMDGDIGRLAFFAKGNILVFEFDPATARDLRAIDLLNAELLKKKPGLSAFKPRVRYHVTASRTAKPLSPDEAKILMDAVADVNRKIEHPQRVHLDHATLFTTSTKGLFLDHLVPGYENLRFKGATIPAFVLGEPKDSLIAGTISSSDGATDWLKTEAWPDPDAPVDVASDNSKIQAAIDAKKGTPIYFLKQKMQYLNRLLKIVADLDQTTLVWGEGYREQRGWGDWFEHTLNGSLTVIRTNFEVLLQYGVWDAELIPDIRKALAKAEIVLDADNALAGVIGHDFNDVPQYWNATYTEKGRSKETPLTKIEQMFFFPNKVFIENPDAERNRAIFIEVVRRMAEVFSEIQRFTEAVRKEYAPTPEPALLRESREPIRPPQSERVKEPRAETRETTDWLKTVKWPEAVTPGKAISGEALAMDTATFPVIERKINYLTKLIRIAAALDDQVAVWGEGYSDGKRTWRKWFDHELITLFTVIQGSWELLSEYGASPKLLMELRNDLRQAEAVLSEHEELAAAIQNDFKDYPQYANASYPGEGDSSQNPLSKMKQAYFFPYKVFIESPNKERNRAIYVEAARRMSRVFFELKQLSEDQITNSESGQASVLRAEPRSPNIPTENAGEANTVHTETPLASVVPKTSSPQNVGRIRSALQAGQVSLEARSEMRELVPPERFDHYLRGEGLAGHPALKDLFSEEIRQVLLEDRALKPVFMAVVSTKDLDGKLEEIDPMAVKALGGTEFFDRHSVFMASRDPDVIENMVRRGEKIVVGVTDRSSEKALMPIFVANLRTVYFPLPDGTWLAVKGVGELYNAKESGDAKVHFWNDWAGRYEGILTASALRFGSQYFGILDNTRRDFIELLASRGFLSLPDGKGGSQPVAGLREGATGKQLEARLLFYRVLTPHRWVKLPQILQSDPRLEKFRTRFSSTLAGLGTLPQGKVLTPSELILMNAEKMGRQEALKQNAGKRKGSLHIQDVTLAGEETDLTSLRSSNGEVNVDQVIVKAVILGTIFKTLDISRRKDFFPDPGLVMKTFFSEYFGTLEVKTLKLWAAEDPSADAEVRSFVAKVASEKLIQPFFHDSYMGPIPMPRSLEARAVPEDSLESTFLKRHILATLRRWAQAELHRRSEMRDVPRGTVTWMWGLRILLKTGLVGLIAWLCCERSAYETAVFGMLGHNQAKVVQGRSWEYAVPPFYPGSLYAKAGYDQFMDTIDQLEADKGFRVREQLVQNLSYRVLLERGIVPPQTGIATPEGLSVYDQSGEVLDAHRRAAIFQSFDEVPEVLKQLLFLQENQKFEEKDNPIIEWKGLARIFFKKLWYAVRYRESYPGGASTIGTQLAKFFYYGPTETVGDKLLQMITAELGIYNYGITSADMRQAKEEQALQYLNGVYLGHLKGYGPVRGFPEAAYAFFGKSPKEMTPQEWAFLVPALKSPSSYMKYPQADLGQWLLAKWLRSNPALDSLSPGRTPEPITKRKPVRKGPVASKFESILRREITQLLGPAMAPVTERDIAVTTSFNGKLQRYMENMLEKLQRRYKGQVDLGFLITDQEGRMRTLAETGKGDFSFVLNGRYSMGSTAKLYWLLYYLNELPETSVEDVFMDTPFELDNGGVTWRPKNMHGVYSNSPMTVREAFYHSNNTVFIRLAYTCFLQTRARLLERFQKKGLTREPTDAEVFQSIGKAFHRYGYSMDLCPHLASVLGASGDNLSQLVNCLQMVASNGVRKPLSLVDSLRLGPGSSFDTILDRIEPEGVQAVRPEVAEVVRDLLNGTVLYGTAHGIVGINDTEEGISVGGKTGTDQENAAVAFVGIFESGGARHPFGVTLIDKTGGKLKFTSAEAVRIANEMMPSVIRLLNEEAASPAEEHIVAPSPGLSPEWGMIFWETTGVSVLCFGISLSAFRLFRRLGQKRRNSLGSRLAHFTNTLHPEFKDEAVRRSETREALGATDKKNLEDAGRVAAAIRKPEGGTVTLPDVLKASEGELGYKLTRDQFRRIGWEELRTVGIGKAHEFDPEARARRLEKVFEIVRKDPAIKKGIYTQDELTGMLAAALGKLAEDPETIKPDSLEIWLVHHSESQPVIPIVSKIMAWLIENRRVGRQPAGGLEGIVPDFLAETNRNMHASMLREVPNLLDFVLGETDRSGKIGIMIRRNGSSADYPWQLMPEGSAGWTVQVADYGLYGVRKDRTMVFVVRLKKRGEKDILKAFRVGPRKVTLTDKKRKSVTVNDLEELPEVPEELSGKFYFGKTLLKKIMTQPEGNAFTSQLLAIMQLKGALLGITGRDGDLSLMLRLENGFYEFRWEVLGFSEAGWRVQVEDVALDKTSGKISLRLLMTREGERSVPRDFVIDPKEIRMISGKEGQKIGSFFQPYVVPEDRSAAYRSYSDALQMIADAMALANIPGYDFRAGQIRYTQLVDKILDETDRDGGLVFSPAENYRFFWALLGRKESGWQPRIVAVQVEKERLVLTIKLSKRGEVPVLRKFSIGDHPITLTGGNSLEGVPRKFWDIYEIGPRRNFGEGPFRRSAEVLTHLMLKPRAILWSNHWREVDFVDQHNIPLGFLDLRGTLSWSPYSNFPFRLAFGLEYGGRFATATDVIFRNGEAFLVVTLTSKEKAPAFRYFRLGPEKKLKGIGAESGNTVEVLAIEPYEAPAVPEAKGTPEKTQEILKEFLVRKKALPENEADSVQRLEAMPFPEIGEKGKVTLSLAEGFNLTVSVPGIDEAGWRGVITAPVRSEDGYVQFDVVFAKDGRIPFKRTYQIGPEVVKVKVSGGEIGIFSLKELDEASAHEREARMAKRQVVSQYDASDERVATVVGDTEAPGEDLDGQMTAEVIVKKMLPFFLANREVSIRAWQYFDGIGVEPADPSNKIHFLGEFKRLGMRFGFAQSGDRRVSAVQGFVRSVRMRFVDFMDLLKRHDLAFYDHSSRDYAAGLRESFEYYERLRAHKMKKLENLAGKTVEFRDHFLFALTPDERFLVEALTVVGPDSQLDDGKLADRMNGRHPNDTKQQITVVDVPRIRWEGFQKLMAGKTGWDLLADAAGIDLRDMDKVVMDLLSPAEREVLALTFGLLKQRAISDLAIASALNKDRELRREVPGHIFTPEIVAEFRNNAIKHIRTHTIVAKSALRQLESHHARSEIIRPVHPVQPAAGLRSEMRGILTAEALRDQREDYHKLFDEVLAETGQSKDLAWLPALPESLKSRVKSLEEAARPLGGIVTIHNANENDRENIRRNGDTVYVPGEGRFGFVSYDFGNPKAVQNGLAALASQFTGFENKGQAGYVFLWCMRALIVDRNKLDIADSWYSDNDSTNLEMARAHGYKWFYDRPRGGRIHFLFDIDLAVDEFALNDFIADYRKAHPMDDLSERKLKRAALVYYWTGKLADGLKDHQTEVSSGPVFNKNSPMAGIGVVARRSGSTKELRPEMRLDQQAPGTSSAFPGSARPEMRDKIASAVVLPDEAKNLAEMFDRELSLHGRQIVSLIGRAKSAAKEVSLERAKRYRGEKGSLVVFYTWQGGYFLFQDLSGKMAGYGTWGWEDPRREIAFRFHVFSEARKRGFGAEFLNLIVSAMRGERLDGALPKKLIFDRLSRLREDIMRDGFNSGLFELLEKHGFKPDGNPDDPLHCDFVLDLTRAENRSSNVSLEGDPASGGQYSEIITPKTFERLPYAKWAPWIRVIDVVVSLPLLIVLGVATVVLTPFIGWPVFFTQERPGYQQKFFKIYKFRTMPVNGLRQATRIGEFLRRTGLDELPQVINILKGEMSIVGPRPILEDELKVYPPYATVFDTRKPGWCSFHMWQRKFGKGPPTREELIRAVEQNADEVLGWSAKLMGRIIFGTGKAMLEEIFGLTGKPQIVGEDAETRRKLSQQDRFIDQEIGAWAPGWSAGKGRMMAVMDGHGGTTVANLLRFFLVPVFEFMVLGSRGNIEVALERTCSILQFLTAWARSGSTLSMAFVPEDRKALYVMIVGDSPVYVLKDREEFISFREHSVSEDPDMRTVPGFEIEEERGDVFLMDSRTRHATSTTRSFGDREFQSVLIRKPQIVKVDLTDLRNSVEVLVASDGLYGKKGTFSKTERDDDIQALLQKGTTVEEYLAHAGGDHAPDNTTVLLRTFDMTKSGLRSEMRGAEGKVGARLMKRFDGLRKRWTLQRRRPSWVKPIHDFTVDRIFQRYQEEKERVTFSWFRNMLKEFVVETFTEKIFSIFSLKKIFTALWQNFAQYGRDVLIVFTVYNICEDWLAAPLLAFFGFKTLAAIVFFGHYEGIVFPAYFYLRWKFQKTFRRQLSPKEKEKIKALIKSKLFPTAGGEGRWKAIKQILWSYPNFPKLLNETLLLMEDAPDISTLTHPGIRELYFKSMGLVLRKEGVKHEDNRRGFELILQGLTDPRDLWVRKVCAGAIGKCAPRLGFQDGIRAYNALTKLLLKEKEPIVRQAILRSMGAFPFEPALEILTEGLKVTKNDFWTQKYAAESIGQVLERLKPDPQVSLSPEVLDAVYALLAQIDMDRQPSVEVRVAAVDALARLGEDTHPALSDLWPLISAHFIAALEQDPDPTVRERALWAIARHSLIDQDPQGDRAQAFEQILLRSITGNFINVVELSERYLRYLYQARLMPFPKELETKVQNALKLSRIGKPVIFISVDKLFEKGKSRASLLSSPKVEAFVKELRADSNLVLYARNFLLDRNHAPIGEDGNIAVFDDYDLARFADVMARLRKGRPSHVPWIDFARGAVASMRTLIPNPEGCLVCIGSAKSLNKLAGAIDLQSRQIWEAEPDHLDVIREHLRKLSDKMAVMPSELTIVPVVDETGRVVGEKPLVNAHLDEDRHLRSVIFVVTSDGRVVRQLKTDKMTSEQGKYDASARAHLAKKETLASCATRALSEKLSVTVAENELIRVGEDHSFVRDQAHDRELVTLWIHFLKPDVMLKPNAPDVGQLDTKFTFQQLMRDVQKHPDQYSRIMREIADAPDTVRAIAAAIDAGPGAARAEMRQDILSPARIRARTKEVRAETRNESATERVPEAEARQLAETFDRELSSRGRQRVSTIFGSRKIVAEDVWFDGVKRYRGEKGTLIFFYKRLDYPLQGYLMFQAPSGKMVGYGFWGRKISNEVMAFRFHIFGKERDLGFGSEFLKLIVTALTKEQPAGVPVRKIVFERLSKLPEDVQREGLSSGLFVVLVKHGFVPEADLDDLIHTDFVLNVPRSGTRVIVKEGEGMTPGALAKTGAASPGSARIIEHVHRMLGKHSSDKDIKALNLRRLEWKEETVSVDQLFSDIPNIMNAYEAYQAWVINGSPKWLHDWYVKLQRYIDHDYKREAPPVVVISDEYGTRLIEGYRRVVAARIKGNSTIRVYKGVLKGKAAQPDTVRAIDAGPGAARSASDLSDPMRLRQQLDASVRSEMRNAKALPGKQDALWTRVMDFIKKQLSPALRPEVANGPGEIMEDDLDIDRKLIMISTDMPDAATLEAVSQRLARDVEALRVEQEKHHLKGEVFANVYFSDHEIAIVLAPHYGRLENYRHQTIRFGDKKATEAIHVIFDLQAEHSLVGPIDYKGSISQLRDQMILIARMMYRTLTKLDFSQQDFPLLLGGQQTLFKRDAIRDHDRGLSLKDIQALATRGEISGRSEGRSLEQIMSGKIAKGTELSVIDLDTGRGEFLPVFRKFLEGLGYRVKQMIGTEFLSAVIQQAPGAVKSSIIHANAQIPEDFSALAKHTFNIVTINNIESAPEALGERAKELLKTEGILLVTIDAGDIGEGREPGIMDAIKRAGFDVTEVLDKPRDYPVYNALGESARLIVAVPKARSEMRLASVAPNTSGVSLGARSEMRRDADVTPRPELGEGMASIRFDKADLEDLLWAKPVDPTAPGYALLPAWKMMITDVISSRLEKYSRDLFEKITTLLGFDEGIERRLTTTHLLVRLNHMMVPAVENMMDAYLQEAKTQAPGKTAPLIVEVYLKADKKEIAVSFVANGVPYDPAALPKTAEKALAPDQFGGRGKGLQAIVAAKETLPMTTASLDRRTRLGGETEGSVFEMRFDRPAFRAYFEDLFNGDTSDVVRAEQRVSDLDEKVPKKKESSDLYVAKYDEILGKLEKIRPLTGDSSPEAVLKRSAEIHSLLLEQLAEEARRIEALGVEDRFGYMKERALDPLRIIIGHLKNEALYPAYRQEIVDYILAIRPEDSDLFDWLLGLLVDNAVFDRTNKKDLAPEAMEKKRQGEQSVNLLKHLIWTSRKDKELYADLHGRLKAIEFRGRYGNEKRERIHHFVNKLIEKTDRARTEPAPSSLQDQKPGAAMPLAGVEQKRSVASPDAANPGLTAKLWGRIDPMAKTKTPAQRSEVPVAFSSAEQRVARDVAEQTLRPEKVKLFSPETWRGFWSGWVTNAYADQVQDSDLKGVTKDVLAKAKDAPFKVSVTLAGKSSVHDPMIQLLADILVKRPAMVVQIVMPGVAREAARQFQQDMIKKIRFSRKEQGVDATGVNLVVTSAPTAVSTFLKEGQVRALVYDMRANVQAELESLALKMTKGETLIVSDAAPLGQSAYALLAALDKLFDQNRLPQTVQSAAQLLAENLRIAAVAAQSVLQSA